jgi:hypothetical protein
MKSREVFNIKHRLEKLLHLSGRKLRIERDFGILTRLHQKTCPRNITIRFTGSADHAIILLRVVWALKLKQPLQGLVLNYD